MAPVVLGHPWFIRHNPKINWGQSSVSEWSENCYASCLVSACSPVSCVSLQDEAVNLSNMPEEYLDLKEVFSKSQAASLPPHRPYDCAIDLVPGMSPPKGRFSSLWHSTEAVAFFTPRPRPYFPSLPALLSRLVILERLSLHCSPKLEKNHGFDQLVSQRN